MHIYTYTCRIHTDAIIKTSEEFFKKYTSHFIWKGSKTLLKVLLWEGVGDRTELHHIDPHYYGHQRLFPALQGSSTGGLGAHSAGCRLPLPHLVTNGSGLQTGLRTKWLPVFTELYNSSIAHSISLEWRVWSSSSGNNCHAVHRSLSSGASVYDYTMGLYLVSYCQPSPPTRFLPINAIGICHFHRLWDGMFGRVEGQYTTYAISFQTKKDDFEIENKEVLESLLGL